MRFDRLAIVSLLAGLAAGCGVTATQSSGGSGTIVLRGQYSSVSNATQALERDLKAEADRQCPNGWTKLGDRANPAAISGGRVWEIRCNPATAAGAISQGPAASAAPPATPPAAAPLPAVPAAAGQAMSRQDLVRTLTAAVMQAAPYLTSEAAQAIVARQLGDLTASRVRMIGPNGQPIPLAPNGD
jgi:hypothetical protein